MGGRINHEKYENIIMTPELQFILFLVIIISASKIFGHLSRRYLRQPVVLGEILAGVLLGPTALNIFGWPGFAANATQFHAIVNLLAQIGVLLLMFIAGLETDLRQLRRVGRVAFSAAWVGVLVPLVLGVLAALLFGYPIATALFIGVILTATSVSITAQTLLEMKQLHAREGTTILGAAVIDDVLGLIILSFVVAFAAPQAGGAAHAPSGLVELLVALFAQHAASLQVLMTVRVLATMLLMALFFAVSSWIGLFQLRRIMVFVSHLHASYGIITATLLLIFLYALGAQYIGQVAAITGAYLAGLFLSRTRYRARIAHVMHPFSYALFVPVFFMSIGLGANARTLGWGSWGFAGVIILVALLSKILGCGAGARAAGFNTREALRVGIGMMSRGEVGLIVAQIGVTSALLGQQEYAVMIIMVLVTTVATPIFLRLAFQKKE
jgi:Kef-type K+ transport system membrane component KefB